MAKPRKFAAKVSAQLADTSTSISDIIVKADCAGILSYVSPACRNLGYEPDDLIGTSALHLIHPDDLDRFLANTAALVSGAPVDRGADREHRFRTASGDWVWLEGNPRVLRDAGGTPVEIVNVFRDVTKRRARQERSDWQRTWRALAEKVAGVGYWRLDLATCEITWSAQMFGVYGLEQGAEPPLAQAMAMVHPDDRAAAEQRLQRARETGEGWSDGVTRLVRPDGELRYVEGSGACERDTTGALVAIYGTMVDATESELAKASLAESETRYRLLAERAQIAVRASQVGIWEWDLQTQVQVWDARMFELYGLPLTDLAPDPATFMAMLHPDDRDRATAKLKAVLWEDSPFDLEFRVRHTSGEVRTIRSLATVVSSEDGVPLRLVGTNSDVTDMRNLEASLHASEARARNVIAHAHQAIVTIDEAGRISGWNHHSELIFGWTAGEAVGQRMAELIVPRQYRAAHEKGMARFIETGAGSVIDQRIEITALRKSGEEFPIELAVSAVKGSAGWEMTALMHDISVRKAQLELFENAFHHAAIGMALVGLKGTFLKVSPALCKIVGYSEAEFLKLDFQTITYADDLDADLNLLGELTEGTIPSYEMEKRYIRADGSLVWIHLSVSMVVNPDGSPRHFIAQVQDLSARREAEAALKDSEARYRLMAENTTDMIITSDLSGRATFVASACVAITGYAPEEMMGQRVWKLTHAEDASNLIDVFQALAAGGPSHRVRWRVQHKSGSHWVWLESGPSLLHDADGSPTGFLDVIRDVTTQVAQEDALAAARAEAEAAAAVKSEFLANMSHEIRTPLTAVLGFSSLLSERTDFDETAQLYVHRVSTASAALLSIVNDILDFSKLEAEQVEIRPKPVSPVEVVRDALALFGPQADEKSLSLECVADDIPELLLLDPDRVRQVLLNLVGNAVKFTETGVVRVCLHYAAVPEALHVSVEDSGPGLSTEQQLKLFQRFSQVDASSTRKHGGTGLGLAICKGLTEAMGGGIEVSSEVGKGTTFSFTIHAPVARAPAKSALEAVTAVCLDGLRVLVVDDSAVNRELARAILEAAGVEVTEAADSVAALEATAWRPVDAILLDLHMPGRGGAETLDLIRQRPGPNQDVPTLAFTADTDLCGLPPGHTFSGIIRKPVSPSALVQAIHRCAQWNVNRRGVTTPIGVLTN